MDEKRKVGVVSVKQFKVDNLLETAAVIEPTSSSFPYGHLLPPPPASSFPLGKWGGDFRGRYFHSHLLVARCSPLRTHYNTLPPPQQPREDHSIRIKVDFWKHFLSVSCSSPSCAKVIEFGAFLYFEFDLDKREFDYF